MSKERVPVLEGWFTADEAAPRLLGNRCTSCKTYFFPKCSVLCRNPNCSGTEFEEVEFSRTGKLWSFTNNCYPPPNRMLRRIRSNRTALRPSSWTTRRWLSSARS